MALAKLKSSSFIGVIFRNYKLNSSYKMKLHCSRDAEVQAFFVGTSRELHTSEDTELCTIILSPDKLRLDYTR
ncbi:hypothetical protein PICMEDRAFT_17385 [Pichia membranifaciens NRRL Y-2026]|uniref:Uncharacterized protein n=1 Tax=Pichia membranifaciens NRRL Y-2026 TaxID=763406 RepID=A0A1E3NFE4_9ASCO|nr:hypothetical protein PICMEDRAFT_17385 [Pichia membranifaciens NRRL Y-2026]ODQ44850.1 hypothetical protein PICMEDRAFT_17385 [Pichia membranifaciens NRRL Y-2026]